MRPQPRPFRPRPPWLTGALQTARAVSWPFPVPLPVGHRLWLPLPDGDALAAMLHWPRPGLPARPLAVLVHGLTGTEDDPYLREAAAGLLRRGHPVLRLGLRGDPVSRPRSTSHYHLGRAEDVAEALIALPAGLTEAGVVLAGWSLGGALVLHLLARHTGMPGMPGIRAAAAICPPLQPELAHAVMDASALTRIPTLARYRSEVLAVAATDLTDRLRLAANRARSLREFEATVSAPRFGFPSYEVFVELHRPANALPQIRVPTLLLMAADDPVVPVESLDGVDWSACPAVAPLLIAGGDHCGFYDRAPEPLSVRAIGAFFAGAGGTDAAVT